jgi:O-antigen/teichoic acid export membrane protein
MPTGMVKVEIMKEFKKGFLFSMMGVYSNFIMQLAVTAILSRVLTPKDYGVVVIIQVFVVFFTMLIESGIGPAIIQDKSLTDANLKSLFNFSVFSGLIIAVAFGFFGLILAKLYSNNVYQSLSWMLAIVIFFNGLNTVPTALLNKEKKFKFVNMSLVFSNFCAGIVGVLLALSGFGYYSLVFSSIIVSVINFIINNFYTKLFPSFFIDWKAVKKVRGFAGNQLGFNLFNYFSRSADTLLIGRYIGSSQVANYGKAYNLLTLPIMLFSNVINPVLQPILSNYQNDISFVRKKYLKIVHILALIGIPVSVFLFTNSKEIIFFMYGSQWKEAIVPFSILSTVIWIQMVFSSSSAIFQARNQTKKLLQTGIVGMVFIVSGIILGVILQSIVYVALFLAIAYVLNFINVFLVLIKEVLESKMRYFIKEFFSPIVLGIIIYVILFIEKKAFSDDSIINLVIRIIIFVITWVTFVIITSERKIFLEFIKNRRN